MLCVTSVPHSASFHEQPLSAAGEGQALGSHRRSHLCSTPDVADVPTIVPSALMKSLRFIDLNLPLSLDDVELSTESELFCSWKHVAS
jgi:hypothetical protein